MRKTQRRYRRKQSAGGRFFDWIKSFWTRKKRSSPGKTLIHHLSGYGGQDYDENPHGVMLNMYKENTPASNVYLQETSKQRWKKLKEEDVNSNYETKLNKLKQHVPYTANLPSDRKVLYEKMLASLHNKNTFLTSEMISLMFTDLLILQMLETDKNVSFLVHSLHTSEQPKFIIMYNRKTKVFEYDTTLTGHSLEEINDITRQTHRKNRTCVDVSCTFPELKDPNLLHSLIPVDEATYEALLPLNR
jgi:hypothetical protein